MTDADDKKDNVTNGETLPIASYTLKVLFGPLYSTELTLPAETYLLITGNEPEVRQLIQEMPQHSQFIDNVLHIPGDSHLSNIRLFLSEVQNDKDDSSNSIRAEIIKPDAISECSIPENGIFKQDGLVFAIKKSAVSWSDEVTHYQAGHALQESSAKTNTAKRQHSGKVKLFCGGFLFISLLLAGCCFLYQQHHSPILSLTSMLSGSTGPVKLLTGRDGKIYALTEKYRDQQWVRESLYKVSRQKDVIPILLPQKQREIVSQLFLKKIPVLQLMMDHPEKPVVQVVGSPDLKMKNELRNILLKELPFARDIVISSVDADKLHQQINDSLKKMHILYQEVRTDNGYAYIINDKLSDIALYNLQKFIEGFYRQWGEAFITFNINLDESWLDGKSYLAAQNGYLYINQHHWLFPTTQK
ncbi:PrgH/EprH family type III secretion apparatus protein [Hafnia paralvei]|uniref:PrgH/EprH family type III secretion apparatus protein n=1 Tax=Hafnia paralvei TaxID=546367 RepID=UPI00300D5181